MWHRFRQLMLWQQGLVVLFGVLVIAIMVVACVSLEFLNWDFRNNLWGPTHLLATGRSPYRIEQLFENSNSVWMPTSIGAFLPLGYLTQYQATTLWATMNLLAYVGCVVWSTEKSKPKPILLALALITAIIFPSFVSHATFGQYSVLMVLITLVLVELIAQKTTPIVLGLLIVLTLTKPQLAILSVPGALFAIYCVGHWRYLLQTIGAIMVWTLILTLPLWIGYPDWLEGFWGALQRNYTWLHPSSLLWLRNTFDDFGTLVWGVSALVIFALNFLLWWNLPLRSAVRWSLALTVWITPYVWSYDFVLLMPLLTFVLFATRSHLSKVAWLLGYALIWAYFFHLRTTTSNSDDLYVWVPSACLLLVITLFALDNALIQRKILLIPTDAPDTSSA
jgi:hypothetical protein